MIKVKPGELWEFWLFAKIAHIAIFQVLYPQMAKLGVYEYLNFHDIPISLRSKFWFLRNFILKILRSQLIIPSCIFHVLYPTWLH